jgi:GNAT superfamily N-acetyltransferase
MEITVREVSPEDRLWAAELLRRSWGAVESVSRGRVHRADELPGLMAVADGRRAGLATLHIDGGECELVTLNSLAPGAGTALLEGAAEYARAAGCRRLWLITTNDNVEALRFYQRRGMRLVALHRDAVEVSRRLKPSIPLLGGDGIPIRDELELELTL